ncbi:MAG: hypothetical protein WA211_16120 [Candidatus Acidiferrales bacterium]|jgi:hypothetical protein
MSMETKHGPGHEPHGAPKEAYERSDANPHNLLKWAVALAVVLVVVFIAMRWLFLFYGKEQSLGRPASPFENARVLPPQPRLQVQPRADLHAYCVQQLATLNSYGWEDQHNGVVRIPIDRAMDLVLQQGLPARAAGDIPPGVSNPAPFVPKVTDAQGPCGYVTERDADHEMSQEAKR